MYLPPSYDHKANETANILNALSANRTRHMHPGEPPSASGKLNNTNAISLPERKIIRNCMVEKGTSGVEQHCCSTAPPQALVVLI